MMPPLGTPPEDKLSQVVEPVLEFKDVVVSPIGMVGFTEKVKYEINTQKEVPVMLGYRGT